MNKCGGLLCFALIPDHPRLQVPIYVLTGLAGDDVVGWIGLTLCGQDCVLCRQNVRNDVTSVISQSLVINRDRTADVKREANSFGKCTVRDIRGTKTHS